MKWVPILFVLLGSCLAVSVPKPEQIERDLKHLLNVDENGTLSFAGLFTFEPINILAINIFLFFVDFEKFLDKLKLGKMHDDDDGGDEGHHHDHDHSPNERLRNVRLVPTHSEGDGDDKNEEISIDSCFAPIDYVDIYQVGTNETSILSYENVTLMFPAIIQQQLSEACSNHSHTPSKGDKPSDAERYGFGTLAIAVISILPFFFIAIIPSAKRQSYRYIMSCLMALSASTMIGDAFLHLLPQALGLHSHSHSHDEEESGGGVEVHDYVLKQVVVIAALYAFYL